MYEYSSMNRFFSLTYFAQLLKSLQIVDFTKNFKTAEINRSTGKNLAKILIIKNPLMQVLET